MANDPFRTDDTYPSKKRAPQAPIAPKRKAHAVEGYGFA
jgi:hypothetical protein